MAVDPETAPAPPVVGPGRAFTTLVLFSTPDEADDAVRLLSNRWPGRGRVSYQTRSGGRPLIVLRGRTIPNGRREEVPGVEDLADGYSALGLVLAGEEPAIREVLDVLYEMVRGRDLRIREKRIVRQGRLSIEFKPASPTLRPPSTPLNGGERTGPTSEEGSA
jgi:hypothetical protein